MGTEFHDGVCCLDQLPASIAEAKLLIAAAQGHLRKLSDTLLEMKNKAEQAASETLSADQRAAILGELQELNAQIDEQVSRALPSVAAIISQLGYEETSLRVARAGGQDTRNRITNSRSACQQLEMAKRVILESTVSALAAQANIDSEGLRALEQ